MAQILIAEDERDIRELIAFTLGAVGHNIIQASNGEDALRLAKENRPDLVMTDVRMPRLTGYELCRAIKNDDALKHIPVIILSAKGQDEEIGQGREVGADDYILKPFGPVELAQRIGEILKELGVS
ncbi:MAG: response regulator [Anaerolineae bacterium]|nr:response regulator [Anaerolineae bacterium]